MTVKILVKRGKWKAAALPPLSTSPFSHTPTNASFRMERQRSEESHAILKIKHLRESVIGMKKSC